MIIDCPKCGCPMRTNPKNGLAICMNCLWVFVITVKVENE